MLTVNSLTQHRNLLPPCSGSKRSKQWVVTSWRQRQELRAIFQKTRNFQVLTVP